jgi:hypothetical protein
MKKIISILASCCMLCGTANAQTNTSYGTESFLSNTTGAYNSAFGKKSLKSNTTGKGNTAIGYMSMPNNVSGIYNTALGGFTLTRDNSNGNTAIGYKSQELATGGGNISLGYHSLQNITGYTNIAIGIQSMRKTINSSENTMVGSSTGEYSTQISRNSGFGFNALMYLTTGNENVAVGVKSGIDITTGSRNTCVGPYTFGGSSGSYNIVMGYRSSPNTGNNNIIIGKKTTLPAGTSNAMNIGCVLFGSGFQSGLPDGQSYTPVGGKIGINVVSPTATLDVAGNVNLSTNITIGGVTAPWYKANSTDSTLRINGTIYSKEINVRTNVWADHVFSNGYQLPSLSSVEQYINSNKHLPEIPSEQEVKANGVDLAQMNVLLLKKVEELTLHMIEQEKRIQELETKNK